jgi:hypothetical protein
MSATLLTVPRLALGIGEFSPVPELLPIPRPAHWLDLARPIFRFLAHPLTMAIAWVAVFLLSAFSCWMLLMIVLL